MKLTNPVRGKLDKKMVVGNTIEDFQFQVVADTPNRDNLAGDHFPCIFKGKFQQAPGTQAVAADQGEDLDAPVVDPIDSLK